ncbi:hypothetical protein [Streptomyces sp. NPDC019937]|uniref:hypothetical protein n=1 Tax=Streptomyces sp. NPDC019937 TaxID=3154787 RepID=UPI0033E506E6
MGVLSHHVRRGRPLLAAVAAVAAAVAATGCEPRDGGVTAIAVSITTDKVGTSALERGGVGVRWLTCNADLKTRPTAGASASGTGDSGTTDATVNCRGRTEDDKAIGIGGRVTYVRKNHCVRGDLTGRIAGAKVFEANVIGECDGGDDTGSPTPARTHPGDGATPTHPWDRRTTAPGK